MGSNLRAFLAAFVFVCSTALAAAQAIIWQNTVPATTYAFLARDTSSNLYFATTTTSFLGRQLNVQKFNALGTKLWEITHNVPGNLGNQYRLYDIAVSSSRVFVLYQERTNSGNGNFVSSQMRVLNMSDGSLVFSLSSSNTVWGAVAANETQVALLGKAATADTGSVSFYNVPAGSFAGLANLGDIAGTADLVMDASGNAYSAAINMNDTTQIARSTAAGGVSWQTTLNDPTRTGETLTKLVVDLAATRVYAIGRGISGATGLDVLLHVLNSSTGAGVVTAPVGATAGDNIAGDISVIPNNGVIVSVVNISANDTSVTRRDTSGSNVWTNSFSSPPVGFGRSNAYDVDGNVLVLSAETASTSKVVRLNVGNGATLGSVEFGVPASARDLLTDSAGNYYVNADLTGAAAVMRVQPARLAFSANNVTGGTAVNGVITLPANAAVNQLWTLASSNSAAASVPASVTLNVNTNQVTFPITVNGVTSNTNVAINARYGGFIVQQTLTLIPSNAGSVVVNPNVVVGGTATQGTVNLTGKAPTGGRTVALTSNKTNVATVPASVVVPAGQSSANFAITTFGVNANQGVVITATTGAVSKTAFFAVNAPSLTSISAPASIKGGQTGTLTLNINGVAPTGGFSIVLFSGAPGIITLPASGVIPAGQTTLNMNMPTSAVTSTTNVLIFATRSGIYKTATVSVTP